MRYSTCVFLYIGVWNKLSAGLIPAHGTARQQIRNIRRIAADKNARGIWRPANPLDSQHSSVDSETKFNSLKRKMVTSMGTALVIDDSRAIRMILGRTLNRFGYEVCSAANGREALDMIGQQDLALSVILVDWNMPEMNGLDFVKTIRADPRYSEVPLMMVTTETEIEQMYRALEAGANEYVMKPFTDEVIADKLRLLGVLQ